MQSLKEKVSRALQRLGLAFVAFFAVLRGRPVVCNAVISVSPQGVDLGDKGSGGLFVNNSVWTDPVAFGASPRGDRDASPAFAAAVAMLSKTGGVVTVPEGTYLLSETLTISNKS